MRESAVPALIIVGTEWLPAANGLWLACFEDKACVVKRLAERQVDGPFVLAEWLRLNSGSRRVFLVGEDGCRDYGKETRCRGSLITDWPGVEIGPTVDLPRKDGASLFRVAEVRGASRAGVAMLGGERYPLFKDGFLSPRTRITLDPALKGAKAVRVRGEVVTGLENVEVTVGTTDGDKQRFTLTPETTSFDVYLGTEDTEKVSELNLDFSDWVVSPDRTARYTRYWGGSRAVSFKLAGIEPVPAGP